jgi:hypothetical protein
MTDVLPFLPIILLFGIVSTYTDVKERRVPNWLLVFAIVAAIGTHVAIVLKAYVAYGTLNWKYIIDQTLNTAFATVLALLLYYGDFAGPADGKMIIAYSLIIPISAYHKGYYFPYPGIVHVAISYVLAYATVLAIGAKRMKKSEIITALKKFFSPKSLTKMFLAIVGLSELLVVAMRAIKANASPVTTILYTLILVITLQKISVKVLNSLMMIGVIIYAIKVISHISALYALTTYFIAAVLLGVLFAPIRVAMKYVGDEKIPMAAFLFVGAAITLLATA